MRHVTPPGLITLIACGTGLIACGPGEYDLDTWSSPLAAEYDGEGDAAEGERIYAEEHWTDGSSYALSCTACHGSAAADTMERDAETYNRPAHTIWNAPYRETWKSSHEWSAEESNVIGAYGGQVCVSYYFTDAEMTAEQAAHLEAYMKTLRDDSPAGDDARAQAFDYSWKTWSTQDDFLTSVGDGSGGWLYGDEIGDVDSGEVLVGESCGPCHTRDGVVDPSSGYEASFADIDWWIARIRRVTVGDMETSSVRMPAFTPDRMPDEDLADVLAYLTRTY